MKKFEKSGEAEVFLVRRSGDKALKFKGWLVHRAKYIGLIFDGELEICLYQTTGGNFVVQEWDWNRAGRSELTAMLCKSDEEIIKFLGQNEYAHSFYGACEIENAVEVD